MHILLFSTSYEPFMGGAEVAIREIVRRVPDGEFEMITARYRRSLPSRERIGNVLVHRVTPGLGRLDRWLLPFFGVPAAWRLHRKQSFDCTHAFLASYAAQAAAWFKQLFPSVPFLLTLQEGQTPERLARRSWWFPRTYRANFRKADTVTVISSFLGDYARTMGVTAPIIRIPNGVSVREFATPQRTHENVRRTLAISPDAFVIITVSRLEPKNGIDTLINAFAEFRRRAPAPPRFLLIAGEGSLLAALRRRVARLDIADDVLFLGNVSHENLPDLLHASDVFARLSRSEGLGNSFLEAMAAGVPVVGTPVGGIPDFLHHEQTGLIVPPDDPAAAAEAFMRILNDRDLRRRITAQARTLVEREFDWENIAPQYCAVYRELT